MKIEQSKKELNKVISNELIDLIIEFVSNLKIESLFATLYFIANYKETHNLSDSIGAAIVCLIIFTILRRMPMLLSDEDLSENITKFNRLEMYIRLRLELKNNVNRFENITPEQLPEELNKLLNLRYT